MTRRLIALLLAVCVVAVSVSGCKTTSEGNLASVGVELKYASGFSIDDIGGGCKRVTDGEDQTLILVPQGKKAPAGYENFPVVTTPVKKAVILSATFGALMRPLDVLDSVVGSGIVESELYIDELKQGYAENSIQYVGGGGMGPPDYEVIQALNPDIVFMSINVSSPDTFEYYEQLKALGIPVAVCNDYLENHPLGRLEWIKFISTFYGKEIQAEEYFDSVEEKISDIRSKVMVSSQLSGVLWSSIFMGDCWVSGGESYVAKMVEMAGGLYAFSDLEGSMASSISIEELYARGQNCDVFIYASTPPYINSIKEIVDGAPVLADMPVIEDGWVYYLQPWFYQISDKIDEVIQDLAFIFHPGLFPGYTLKHFHLLPAE